jgi:hypothetical protein
MKKIVPIKDYEKEYMISDDGIVFRVNKYGLSALKASLDKDGYLKITLCKDGVKKNVFIHRLVAEAFVKRKNAFCKVVNHIDENKQNNKATNLEWCTVKYNNEYNDGVKRRAKKRQKPIVAYDDSNVMEFNSIKEASEFLQINRGNISTCLAGGRNTAGGLRFAYKSLWGAK